MSDLVNQKTGFVLGVAKAKNIANFTGETQMVYVYNKTAGDFEGHHVIISKSIDDTFKDDNKLDFVKEVIPEN